MTVLDLELLLAPLSEEAPSGKDPEGDDNPELYAKLLDLQSASEGKPEQEYGDKIIPAEPPKWKEIKKDALAVFEQTKSLNVAVMLTRATTHMHHLPGLADGLKLIAGLLDRYWLTLYPLLDEENNNDLTDRQMALEQFNSKEALRDVRACQLVSLGTLGSYTIRDFLLAKGSPKLSPASDEVPVDLNVISGAMIECDLEDLQAVQHALESCDESIGRIVEIIRENRTGGDPFDLSELQGTLSEVAPFVSDSLERRGQVAGGAAPADDAGSGLTPTGTARAGEINSREDAIRMLDRISEYFNRNEPSSPVPLLLQRAKRLVAQDFISILGDIAPVALDQVRNISGLDSSDSSD